MPTRRARTPPAYNGPHPAPRFANPREKLLGDEYDSFIAEWEKRLAEREASTFYSVPNPREYLQRQNAAMVTEKPDPLGAVKYAQEQT